MATADQLTRLGLTSYEAKAYLALLRRDSSTAAQAARLANVPRQRIYDVLASLVYKGLASTRPGQVVKYAAVAPELALERLVSDHRDKLAELERETAELIDELRPAFHAGKEQANPLEYIEVLRDRRAINERFEELQAGIKDEILVFTKKPYATPPQEEVVGLEVTKSHEARSVYEFDVFDDPDTTEGVRRFVEAGEKARFVPDLPLKLVIIDESIVMFGMEDPVAGSSELTIMVVEHPSLAGVLKTAFDTTWEQGLTFDEAYDRLVARRKQTAESAHHPAERQQRGPTYPSALPSRRAARAADREPIRVARERADAPRGRGGARARGGRRDCAHGTPPPRERARGALGRCRDRVRRRRCRQRGAEWALGGRSPWRAARRRDERLRASARTAAGPPRRRGTRRGRDRRREHAPDRSRP